MKKTNDSVKTRQVILGIVWISAFLIVLTNFILGKIV
jgi:hypothetical protein